MILTHRNPLGLTTLFLLLLVVSCARGGTRPAPQAAAETKPAALSTPVLGTPALVPPTGTSRRIVPAGTATPVPTSSPTPRAAVRLEQAQEAERVGDWATAFRLYESLREDPQHAHAALFYLGDLYLRDDRAVEAAAAWQLALLREPEGAFANPLRYRLARGLATIGQHAGAVRLLAQLDARNDGADDLLAQRLAESYQALGESDQAVVQWERIYRMDAASRVSRAWAARALGDWHAANARAGEALEWYERTLELARIREYRAELIAGMADLALTLEDSGYARNQWLTLVEEYPAEPQALAAAARLAAQGEPLSRYREAELLLANERWREAARAFFDSLEVEDRAEAHAGAARALEEVADWATAQREWQKLLDTHPEAALLHPQALLGIARTAARQGDAATALTAWARIDRDFPDSEAAPLALAAWADWLSEQDREEEAAAKFTELADAHPDAPSVPDALWQAGMIWYRAGEGERARQTWERAARLDREQPARALFWAGKAALLEEDPDAAARLWQQATRRAPATFYGLRADAALAVRGWQPRATTPIVPPDADTDPAWLREAANLPAGADPLALPDDPALARGDLLLLLGERDLALDSFREVIQTHREEPQALWALAHAFRTRGLNAHSILAAQRLMELEGYTVLDAPPALGVLVYPLPFDPQLRAAAVGNDLDPLFLAALIYQESTWEPRARSSAAARGLAQVIPDTGSWIAQRLGDRTYRYRDLDRPVVALRYGSYYLDYLLTFFDDNPWHALAGYNSGPGNARRWLGPDDDLYVESIPFPETQLYIERVYLHWSAYQRLYR